jgi:ABC-type transport system involved in multi-copper enzyme maturation permease subunit
MKADSMITTIQVEPSGGWLAQVGRMIGWNIYQMRRRTMSKILGLIYVLPLLIMLGIFFAIHKPDLLAYPSLFRNFSAVMSSLGPLLLPILAATLIGSEYTYGIQRQLLGRGMSRTQVYAAQLLSLATITLLVTGVTLLLGLVLSLILGAAFGAQMTLPTGGDWGSLVLYWLAHTLNIYFFVTIAVFISTLGRNPIAGTAVALGYQIFEILVRSILMLVASLFDVNMARTITHIVEWLPGSVTQTVLNGAGALLFHDPSPPASAEVMNPGTAFIILLVYLLILLFGGYLLYSRRDMTE